MSVLNVEDWFSSVTLTRARDIVKRKEVMIEHGPDEHDNFLSGLVQGSARRPYAVQVFLDDDEVDSYCSCPVGSNCKHGAALLLVWLASNKKGTDAGVSVFRSERHQRLAKVIGADKTAMQWVDDLVRVLEPEPENVHEQNLSSELQIIYKLVSVPNHAGTTTLGVHVMQASVSDSGDFHDEQFYPMEEDFGHYTHAVHASDEIIIDLLRVAMERSRQLMYVDDEDAVPLQGSSGAYVLSQMVDTGRLYWNNEREVPIRLGAEKSADVSWDNPTSPKQSQRSKEPNGKKHNSKTAAKKKRAAKTGNPTAANEATIQITTTLHRDGKVLLADTQPLWYIDPQKHKAGIVRSNYSAAILNAATEAPALPLEAAQPLSNIFAANAHKTQLPLPVKPSIEFVQHPMVCRIRVYSADGSAQVSQWTVQVLMCYGVHKFHVQLQPESQVSWVTRDDGVEIEVTRDHDKEYRQYQFFRRRVSGFEPAYAQDPKRFTIADHKPLARNDTERFRSFERLFDAFETLESEGFEILVEPPVSLKAESVSDFDFDLQPVDNGWFDLGLQLKHEGTSYNLLPLILHWLAQGDRNTPLTIIAEDGRRLSVSPDMVRPVADTLMELYDDSKEQVAITRGRALSLTRLSEELNEAGGNSEWHGDTSLLALAEKIERVSANQDSLLKAAKAPKTLNAELRPYQLTGMAWLNFLHEAELCGVLADDMGLGKTVQTLAHVLSLKQRRRLKGPVLVVAPTSVLHNWSREAQKFAPSLNTRVWHGAERHDEPLTQCDALLVVTSYALALRDQALLAAHGFVLLVLDEAQTIKNPSAKITQALKRMPISQRICLTGTPLENHLGELWSLFDFLMPGMLGGQKRFSQHFRTPIEKHGDADRQRRLNNAIAPFLLRRRKHAVAAELPPKTTVIRKIKLDAEQARLYETIRVSMEKRVRQLLQERGVARSHIQMLDALLKLRQSCCHPQLVKLDSARKVKTSAKTDHVLGMIEELVAEGRKIILFSQFTQMLDILERELDKKNIEYVKLTGRTRKREVVIDAFQNGDVPLFLVSLKAGGTGLNLTAADTVIHYDPWWNPAVENQATDRAHRIGQDKPVFVYKLIAENTVEDKIIAMQARKQNLADATVERGDANPVKSLSSDDILSLFAED